MTNSQTFRGFIKSKEAIKLRSRAWISNELLDSLLAGFANRPLQVEKNSVVVRTAVSSG
jgi:hypothetical protein